MSLTLAVVIYNNGHWCLYAAEDVESREERANNATKLYKLGEIEEDGFAGVLIAISQVPLKNDEKNWGCKIYVIDCMEKLERLGFLDENDEDYSKVKTELQEIINTRRDAADGDDDDKDNGEDDNGDEEEEDDDDGDNDEPRNICSSELVENSSDEE